MEEKNVWEDLFQKIRNVESAKAGLESAYVDRDKEIASLYKVGIPPATIARRGGLDHSTIHKILKQQDAKS